MSFGETLREMRRAKGKSQRQTADAIGMDYAYISRLENDRFDSQPTHATIEKIGSALECTAEEFRRLLAAAGRIDHKVEMVARIATSERPELGELLLAAVDQPPETIERIIEQLRREVGSDDRKSVRAKRPR